MPLYKLSLRQATDASFARRFKWSTTFIVSAPNAPAAAALGVSGWVGQLREGARTTVFCYEVYATSLTVGDDDYVTQGVPAGQQRGTQTVPVGSGEPYWPEVCVSVTIPTITGGRPSRKFWRPGLYEGDLINGVELAASIALPVVNAFAEFISLASPFIVDPDGQELSEVVTVRPSRRALGREAGFNLPVPPPVG